MAKYVQKLLCDHCNTRKVDVYYHEETDTAMCSLCMDEYDAKAHSNYVASMESDIANSWQCVEVYEYRQMKLVAGALVTTLTAVNGIVRTHERRDIERNTAVQLSLWRGMETWGLRLRFWGYRKVSTVWENTITGEITDTNPHK